MPSPAPDPMNVAAALQHLQKQVDQLARRPAAGGGALGYARLVFTITAPTSNGTDSTATAITVPTSVGDVDINPTGGHVGYCASGTPCLYVAMIWLRAMPTTNAVSTDVHQFTFGDASDNASFTSIGAFQNAWMHATLVQYWNSAGPTSGFPATLNARCTGGTNRSYNIGLEMFLARYALP